MRDEYLFNSSETVYSKNILDFKLGCSSFHCIYARNISRSWAWFETLFKLAWSSLSLIHSALRAAYFMQMKTDKFACEFSL
jgi:hypothetical protein